MYCVYCGTKLPENAKFCLDCGKKVPDIHTGTKNQQGYEFSERADGTENQLAEENVFGALEMEPSSNEATGDLNENMGGVMADEFAGFRGDYSQNLVSSEAEALRTYIGKKADYYLRKWELDSGGQKIITWNWAAFFLPVFWAGYRKMYGVVFAYFGIILVIDLLSIFSHTDIIPSLGIVLSILFGMYGNHFYCQKVKKDIAKCQTLDGQYSQSKLVEKGGVSPLGLMLVIIAFIVYLFFTIIFSLFYYTGEIEFGYGESDGYITDATNTFTVNDEIYFSFEFPLFTSGEYEVIIFDSNNEVYDYWSDRVPPDWHGVIDYIQAPEIPGKYKMQIMIDGEVSAEGTFHIKEDFEFTDSDFNRF